MTEIREVEVNFLFPDDSLRCTNTKDLTHTHKINASNKTAGYKVTHKNQLTFYILTMNNLKKISNTIPFIIAPTKLKYLAIY